MSHWIKRLRTKLAFQLFALPEGRDQHFAASNLKTPCSCWCLLKKNVKSKVQSKDKETGTKLGINRWPREKKMADEKNAEVVSGEEKITDEDNQSVMSDGLMQIFKPAVQELDEKVLSVRYD